MSRRIITPWLCTDIKLLKQLSDRGLSDTVIGRKLKRSTKAIYLKRKRLGIKKATINGTI